MLTRLNLGWTCPYKLELKLKWRENSIHKSQRWLWLINYRNVYCSNSQFYREFKQGFVRLHVQWEELIYETLYMARSSWNHGKILSKSWQDILLKSWQDLVEIIATSCRNHGKIFLKSWQDLVEIMARSWQHLAKSWILGKILLKSWQNLVKIMTRSYGKTLARL